MNQEANLMMAKLWTVGAAFPFILLALMLVEGDPGVLEVVSLTVLNSIACIGAATIAYSNYRRQKALKESGIIK